jgi:hypothetical protein
MSAEEFDETSSLGVVVSDGFGLSHDDNNKNDKRTTMIVLL